MSAEPTFADRYHQQAAGVKCAGHPDNRDSPIMHSNRSLVRALLRHLRAALPERAPTCIYRGRGLVFRAEWGPLGGSRGRLRLLLGERNWPEPAEGCELGA